MTLIWQRRTELGYPLPVQENYTETWTETYDAELACLQISYQLNHGTATLGLAVSISAETMQENPDWVDRSRAYLRRKINHGEIPERTKTGNLVCDSPRPGEEALDAPYR